MKDARIRTKTGTKRRTPTTVGCELLNQSKDCTNRWVRLPDMNESCPIETAEK